MIDPHHKSRATPFCRGGNNDPFGACLKMLLRILCMGKVARGFNHILHAKLFPGELSGIFFRKDQRFFAIDDKGFSVSMDVKSRTSVHRW